MFIPMLDPDSQTVNVPQGPAGDRFFNSALFISSVWRSRKTCTTRVEYLNSPISRCFTSKVGSAKTQLVRWTGGFVVLLPSCQIRWDEILRLER